MNGSWRGFEWPSAENECHGRLMPRVKTPFAENACHGPLMVRD
ncbi:hypothetical protein [Bacillus sp. JJ1773]